MKILLTGGTGFIGSHFLKLALEAGHTVLALRRSLVSKPRISLPHEPIWLDKQMSEVSVADVEGCSVVVHLAAHGVVETECSLLDCLRFNVTDPLKLFHVCADAGIDHFVIGGSCFEYGRSADAFARIPVNAPLLPTTPYGASKAAASLAFCSFAETKRLRMSIERIFHVYGPGEAVTRFWPSLREAALRGEDFRMTSGEQIRDFLPVNFVAERLVSALDPSSLVLGEPLIRNLGTGEPRTILEFAQDWWKAWDAKGQLAAGALPYRKGEIMSYVPEI